MTKPPGFRPQRLPVSRDLDPSVGHSQLMILKGLCPPLLCRSDFLYPWSSYGDRKTQTEHRIPRVPPLRDLVMGGFRAVEDRPTPKEVYNWRLYLEAAVISFGSLLYVTTNVQSPFSSNCSHSSLAGSATTQPSSERQLPETASRETSISQAMRRTASPATSPRHSRLVPFSVPYSAS